MQILDEIISGKAKSLYRTDDPKRLVMRFRNDTSAFDGEKTAQLDDKGRVNNHINAFVMKKIEEGGVPTHFVKLLSGQDSLVRSMEMLPIECVVRNIATGSLCRRLGIEEGLDLEPPLFEFFLKNDALHDPMINDFHILTFGWATREEIEQMKSMTFRVNEILKKLFAEAGILLVDYKLEFGRCDGRLMLGDEFSPDGCRLWDMQTREKLDKDRFRQDLGDVVETYRLVAERLGIQIDH
ncbi:MAG: phosphoribosylaminoimidazolesuccinocarboxamide synthase [Gammaproteobacteria bacterium]|nr:MAG: phosphoribosylaminoimidazolesuccinocarboxamide synthase [Gammaproteobacteria bacterium]